MRYQRKTLEYLRLLFALEPWSLGAICPQLCCAVAEALALMREQPPRGVD